MIKKIPYDVLIIVITIFKALKTIIIENIVSIWVFGGQTSKIILLEHTAFMVFTISITYIDVVSRVDVLSVAWSLIFCNDEMYIDGWQFDLIMNTIIRFVKCD